MSDVLLRHDEKGLCTLTLNRPDKLNALNTEVFERLDEELAKLEQQMETIHCVVLRGAGRSFCAGADLGVIASGAKLPPLAYKPKVIERLGKLPQPVIVAAHGNCVTGGLELALAADLIVATETARFADTHAKFGLLGGWGMTQRLPRRIGTAQAKLMMFTARMVPAPEALSIGLIDLCFPDDQFDARLQGLVDSILANSPFTTRETKKLVDATSGMSLDEGLAYEIYNHPGIAPDSKDRMAAFSAKK